MLYTRSWHPDSYKDLAKVLEQHTKNPITRLIAYHLRQGHKTIKITVTPQIVADADSMQIDLITSHRHNHRQINHVTPIDWFEIPPGTAHKLHHSNQSHRGEYPKPPTGQTGPPQGEKKVRANQNNSEVVQPPIPGL